MIFINIIAQISKIYTNINTFNKIKNLSIPTLQFLYFYEFLYYNSIYLKINNSQKNKFTYIFNYLNNFKKILFGAKKKTTIYNVYRVKILILINFFLFNIKSIVIAFIVSFSYFIVSLFYIQIDLSKQLIIWYIVGISYYLIISCFNSFLVKYRYGKFTTAIQRFWKRTGTIFWLIEGFLFLLFFYYFLNSSQEPLYMFDYSSLNQELLIQLKTSYKNMILISLAIFFCFILMLNINFFTFYQSIVWILIISLIIFYTLYIESYQFVYILNIFADKEWIFDESEQIWELEIEENNIRVKQQYFVLCLIAKYWHFIFIFISWFFFLIKSLEANKITITLLSYNLQNLLILYVLNILCLVQWIKFIYKKFFEIVYYWFFTQYDEKFIITFFNELKQLLINYICFNNKVNWINLVNISEKIYFSNELTLWKYVI